jgi:hypothetical protein
VVDLRDESWNATTPVLKGSLAVIGGEPNQLRIVAPQSPRALAVKSVAAVAENAAPGVTASFEQRGPMVRVTVRSPSSQTVRWTVEFTESEAGTARISAVRNLRAAETKYEAVRLAWDADASSVLWRVRRSDGATFNVNEPVLQDHTVAPATAYRYEVSALAWEGEESPKQAIEVKTPDLPEPGPVPPTPEFHLSDLRPEQASTGWGKVEKDRSAGNRPIKIAGQTFARGLGVHANSLLSYELKPEYRRFVAVAGLDDEEKYQEDGSVVFIVRVVNEDGSRNEAARSPTLTWNKLQRWHFDVELPRGARSVELEVTDADGSIRCDHADWAQAGFVR